MIIDIGWDDPGWVSNINKRAFITRPPIESAKSFFASNNSEAIIIVGAIECSQVRTGSVLFALFITGWVWFDHAENGSIQLRKKQGLGRVGLRF